MMKTNQFAANRKDEMSWVSKSEYIYQQQRTYKLYSIILYVWAFQVLSAGFQGGCMTHASIVGRREEETNESKMIDKDIMTSYFYIWKYIPMLS